MLVILVWIYEFNMAANIIRLWLSYVCHRESQIPFFKKPESIMKDAWKILPLFSVSFLTCLLQKLCASPWISSLMWEWWITLCEPKKQLLMSLKKVAETFFFSLSFSHGKLIYLVHINANALCFDVTFLRLQSTLNSFICLCKCCTVSNSGINLTRKVLYFSFSVDWSKWMR